MIKLHVLLLLKTAPKSGYELMGEIKRTFGNSSPSQIYPFLAELFQKKFVSALSGSRDKKTYALTKKGNKLVEEISEKTGGIVEVLLKSRVKKCTHCSCEIYKNGVEINKKLFCCEHCAIAWRKKWS